MSRFAPALRKVARELDLPPGVRTAILLELAADLEAVFEHHRSRGLGEAEAARRAEERVLGSGEVVRRLARLHRRQWPSGSWAAWRDPDSWLSTGLDRVLVSLGVLPVVSLTAGVALWALAGEAPAGLWGVVGVGVGMAWLVGRQAARLLRGRPLAPRALSRLLVVSALAVVAGLLAAALGVQGAAAPAAGTSLAVAELAGRAAVYGAVLLVGLLFGLVGALAWRILAGREARRAAREVERLLSGSHSPPAPATTEEPVLSLVRRRNA